MTFPLAVEVFDLRDDLFFYFKNDIGICDKGVIAGTLFLSSAMPKTSLVVLILLTSLALIDRLLPIRHINRWKVSRLNLLRVFFYN